MKYLGITSLTELVSKIKAKVVALIPTKVSDLTNDSGYGKITKITAGTGLTGGGTSGTVSLAVSYGTTSKTACVGNDSRLSNSRTPTSHATSSTTYGVGTASNYGHCKVINNLTTSSASDGYALNAYQGYLLNQNKLDVSAKATQEDATDGTNDSKYMTPLDVKVAINSKQSATDGNFSTDALTSTSWTTYSFSKSVKSRFIMLCFGDGSTSTPDYNGCTALFDCRNNSFLFGITQREHSTSDILGFAYNSLPKSYNVRNNYMVSGEITSCSYSNGTLSFSIRGKIGSSSISNQWKLYIKVIELDGLLS